MHKSFALLLLTAALFGGCVTMPPPANRSASDPSDASAPEASARSFRPNLVATTQVYLDPSVGRGAQKMDHSKMQGMGGMEGMDHSKMEGMDKQQPGSQPNAQGMQGMDHSKMPGMTPSPAATPPPQSAGMQGMDHGAMKGMALPTEGAAASPPSKEVLDTEMQKTSDEMKRLSDELKAKTDAARAGSTPSPAPQHEHP